MAGPRISKLLPSDPREYHGQPFAWWVAVAYLSILTIRSLVHLLSSDGGAASIATMDTSGGSGDNIIALFGQWGASQLLFAAVLWTLLLRYGGLTPFVLLVCLAEPFLRALSGHLKPVQTLGTAPGESLNWMVVPLLVVVLYFSLRERRRPAGLIGNGQSVDTSRCE